MEAWDSWTFKTKERNKTCISNATFSLNFAHFCISDYFSFTLSFGPKRLRTMHRFFLGFLSLITFLFSLAFLMISSLPLAHFSIFLTQVSHLNDSLLKINRKDDYLLIQSRRSNVERKKEKEVEKRKGLGEARGHVNLGKM